MTNQLNQTSQAEEDIPTYEEISMEISEDDRKRHRTEGGRSPIDLTTNANNSDTTVTTNYNLIPVNTDTLSWSPENSTSTTSVNSTDYIPVTMIENFRETDLPVIDEDEFVWNLADWTDIPLQNDKRVATSPVFTVGGVNWTINYGLAQRSATSTSVSLHLAVEREKKLKNSDWSVCAEIILGIFNPQVSNATNTVNAADERKEDVNANEINFAFSQNMFHRFCDEESDWGFSNFCSASAFTDGIPQSRIGPLASSIDNSTCIIAKVRVLKDVTGVLWHNFNNYNSKRVTGYVGLLNQGATCYMNSFLQSIFLTNEFRAAVYKIPTASVSSSIPLALQRIFYKLQTAVQPSSTIDMTKSFGWDSAESFMQHDVQEFSRVLLDDLESKMKGTDVEGTVERLFRGKLKNVLKCTQVEYESIREESFYDLQLTIKGVSNLEDSFRQYVANEMLCGDNQYRTDDFGLQDARKFIEFEHFPPVLHIHLERYAFDMMAEATVKIHDRFEFPTEISLDPYLSETSPDRDVSQQYWLHSVLVHAGDGHGGHYFVYIRHPSNPDLWYKFDDTRVIPCTEHEAVNDNFGGYESVSSEESQELLRRTGVKPYRYKKFTSAYLLVYIRKVDLDSILRPIEEADVPKYLIERINADDMVEARRRYEKQQQYLYTDVAILCDDSIRSYQGSDLYDYDLPSNRIKMKRDSLLSEIKEEFIEKREEEMEAYDDVEIYNFLPRRNKTLRPDILVSDPAERTISSFSNRVHSNPVTFLLRPVNSKADIEFDLFRVPMSHGKMLIYVKWFEPTATETSEFGKLTLLGSVVVYENQLISSLSVSIKNKLADLNIIHNPEGDLTFYEELKASKIVLIESGQTGKTFKEAQLRHGDIIIVEQRARSPFMDDSESSGDVKTVSEADDETPSPIDFFADLISWKSVDVAPIISNYNSWEAAEVPVLNSLENVKISLRWNYKQLTDFLAKHLQLKDANHLRILFSNDSNSDNIKPSDSVSSLTSDTSNVNPGTVQFLPSKSGGSVKDFLIGTSSGDSITILYEITKMSVKEAEGLVRYYVQPGLNEKVLSAPAVVYLSPYVSTVKDLFKALQLSEVPNQVRLLECIDGRIKRMYSIGGENDLLTPINPLNCTLLIESAAAEESPKLISCFTFEKAPTRSYGLPFKIDLIPDETLTDFKTRLAKKLALLNDTFPVTANLYLCSWSRERKLEDENEVLARIPALGSDEQLGIQLLDPSKQIQRSASAFDGAIRFRKQE